MISRRSAPRAHAALRAAWSLPAARSLAVVLPLTVLHVLPACPGEGVDRCNVDADCGAGRVCASGECVVARVCPAPRPAVRVTVTSSEGVPVCDATVTIAGVALVPALETGGACGFEGGGGAGIVTVHASADGFLDGSVDVELARDDCGFVTAEAALALEPIIACTSAADCPRDAVCAAFANGALACRAAPSGARAIGDACTDDGESDACADGLCDDAIVGRCTRACRTDADCPGINASPDAQSICTSLGVDGIDARACFEPCASAAVCTGGRACRARSDLVDDAIEFACDGPRGPQQVNDEVVSGTLCASNFAVLDVSGHYCSAPCTANVECPLPMACGSIAVTTPSGGAQQILSACARQP